MNNIPDTTTVTPPPRGRLWIGGGIFVAGQLAPLTIPLIARSTMPTAWKTVLSAVLFATPELFILLAVAVLGKPGFDYLTTRIKRALARFFAEYGPPDTVSRRRYTIGLVIFALPLIFGWSAPYFGHHIPGYESHVIWYSIIGDLVFVVSLFVLGGDFWDKLRALFIHGAKTRFPADDGAGAAWVLFVAFTIMQGAGVIG
jgi:hypothetical protein